MLFNSVIQFRGHLGRRNYGAKFPQQFRRFAPVRYGIYASTNTAGDTVVSTELIKKA